MKPIKPKTRIILLLTFGTVIGLMGIVISIVFPFIMTDMIKKKLAITDGSLSYTNWKDIPVPIYLHIYLFNVTNTEDVYNLNSKPNVEEIGPYTFREVRKKVNIGWNENGTLSYRQIKTYHFRPDMSNGSLDDEITTVNAIMMAAAAKAKEYNSLVFYISISEAFNLLDSQWFVTRKAREFLFEGYTDRLFNFSRKFGEVPFDKFGWFYGKNATDDGEYTIYTGVDNINMLDKIDLYNGFPNVTAFDPPCNEIHGTAGDMWAPLRKEGGNIGMFISDICRTIHFKYIEKSKVQNLETFRYWADNTQLDNGKINPENKCFCHNNDCYPAGALDVSRCKFGAPAAASYPHFLYGDSSYLQRITGLNPDPDKHKMYIDIEPTLGIPLSVAARMQVNVIMEGNKKITQFSNITGRIFYPVFWFSETAVCGKDVADQLRVIVKTVPIAVKAVSYFFIGLGGLLIAVAFFYGAIYTKKIVSSNDSDSGQDQGPSYTPVTTSDIPS